MKTTVRHILILALLFPSQAAQAGNEVWSKYVPPTKDFEVQMPGEITVKNRLTPEKGKSYLASSNHRIFHLIAISDVARCGTKEFEKFCEDWKESTRKEKADFVSSKATIGAGWTGTLFESKSGEKKSCWLLVRATAAPWWFVLHTDGLSSDPQTQKFFNSFVVHAVEKKNDR